MSRSEVIISTKDLTREEEHTLIALIARCGYAVYFGWDGKGVAFTVDTKESITQIKGDL